MNDANDVYGTFMRHMGLWWINVNANNNYGTFMRHMRYCLKGFGHRYSIKELA